MYWLERFAIVSLILFLVPTIVVIFTWLALAWGCWGRRAGKETCCNKGKGACCICTYGCVFLRLLFLPGFGRRLPEPYHRGINENVTWHNIERIRYSTVHTTCFTYFTFSYAYSAIWFIFLFAFLLGLIWLILFIISYFPQTEICGQFPTPNNNYTVTKNTTINVLTFSYTNFVKLTD